MASIVKAPLALVNWLQNSARKQAREAMDLVRRSATDPQDRERWMLGSADDPSITAFSVGNNTHAKMPDLSRLDRNMKELVSFHTHPKNTSAAMSFGPKMADTAAHRWLADEFRGAPQRVGVFSPGRGRAASFSAFDTENPRAAFTASRYANAEDLLRSPDTTRRLRQDAMLAELMDAMGADQFTEELAAMTSPALQRYMHIIGQGRATNDLRMPFGSVRQQDVLTRPVLMQQFTRRKGMADGGPVTDEFGGFAQQAVSGSGDPAGVTGPQAMRRLGTAAARGAAAGVLGAPADLLDLLRMIGRGGGQAGLLSGLIPEELPPALQRYTSEELLKRFPGAQAVTGPEQATEFAGTVLAPIGAVSKTGRAIGRGALSLAQEALSPGPVGATAQRGVIKAPGGNWVSGSVEGELDSLLQAPGQQSPAIKNWIDKQLARYVKNQMATELDPVRALAERGVLHYSPEPVAKNEWLSEKRKQAGFSGSGAASSELAGTWEAISDEMLAKPMTAKQLASIDIMQRNPWAAKLDPKTPFYSPSFGFAKDTGFDHLIDELRNATNPASGLPRELQLRPESLERLSVPQAVERVAKINEWRAAQKVEANQALANNAATVPVKEYPEAGLRWVEIAPPKLKLEPGQVPEGYEVTTMPASAGSRYKTKIRRPDGSEFFDSSDDVEKILLREAQREKVREALQYEGDTMGHCVGGYCPDVLEGRSRIFSLRDEKGQPHVTIEVNPKIQAGDFVNQRMSPEMAAKIEREANDLAIARARADGEDPDDIDVFTDYLSEAQIEVSEKYARTAGDLPSVITQIKGKGNKKPAEKYIPFVQDFVRSQGPWSGINELGNADLLNFQAPTKLNISHDGRTTAVDVPAGFFSAKELQQMLMDAGVPESEAAAQANNFGGRRFASGGSVTAAQKEAGNYPKGHVWHQGLNISIETPAGAERSGEDKDGQAWSIKMPHDYGYIRGMVGKDKDHLDVHVGPEPREPSRKVFVVDQIDPDTGKFDEHKVMLGFPNEAAAVDAYHAAYEPGWRGFGAVTGMTMPDFKRWAAKPRNLRQPAGDIE